LKELSNNSRVIRFLIEPKCRIYRHLLILFYITGLGLFLKKPEDHTSDFSFIRNALCWNTYMLAMFYINMYVLIPLFLYKGKYTSYILFMILVIVSCYLLTAEITQSTINGYRIAYKQPYFESTREFLIAMHKTLLMVFASTSIKLFQRWVIDNNRINELEKSSLQSELRELKNQINPHFLFNMLNNVNVLVRKDPGKASQVILKLSDFLRHQLYGNNQQQVLLSDEIHFLNDFMELETIRRDAFSFHLSTDNKSDHPNMLSILMLPPNLFIPFVENAVKHSFDPDLASEVQVVFTVYSNRLVFECRNTKPGEPVLRRESGGLGLANIKRRLELLYRHRFVLLIDDGEKAYTLTLTLPL
jgi:two-component system LytT family sensor kinase